MGNGAFFLPRRLEDEWRRLEESWQHDQGTDRLWQRDATLWTGGEESRWLGWLDADGVEPAVLERTTDWARSGDFDRALLLGMGGSSLGSLFLSRWLAPAAGFPRLEVLDSTDPGLIRQVCAALDPERSLVLVASKSGSTLETDLLSRFFYARWVEVLGARKAGQRMLAITDPGSKLERRARQLGFFDVVLGDPEIGGRFSVLSPFGLVPAAVGGLDVVGLGESAREAARACRESEPRENPGVSLGLLLAAAWRLGRDKVCLLLPPSLTELGLWIEQLLAESTGKDGKGLVPVTGDSALVSRPQSQDRVFVAYREEGEAALEPLLRELQTAGHPVLDLPSSTGAEIGAELYRWQVATAVAGSVLGVNPFDQPDVEAAKVATRAYTSAIERGERIEPPIPAAVEGPLEAFDAQGTRGDLARVLSDLLETLHPGDYCALLSYLPADKRTASDLDRLRRAIGDRMGMVTVVGTGPRYLHSTGQLFKGGSNRGVFLILTTPVTDDLEVPDCSYSFGDVFSAQALGDFDVLVNRQRRALRLELAPPLSESLSHLCEIIEAAVEDGGQQA